VQNFEGFCKAFPRTLQTLAALWNGTRMWVTTKRRINASAVRFFKDAKQSRLLGHFTQLLKQLNVKNNDLPTKVIPSVTATVLFLTIPDHRHMERSIG